MDTVHLRRIRCADADALERLAALRSQLSSQGEVVSPRSRQLTEAVFSEALPPARVVERICTDVRQRGLAAVLHYTEKLDRVKLTEEKLRVDLTELKAAHADAAPAFLATIRRVRQNVLSFQMG